MTLALIMLMGCVLTFASCSFGPKPELDIDDAEEALEDENYSVSVNDDPSDPMYEATLSASNEDDYLRIVWFENASVAKLYYKSLKLEREQEIESLKLEIKTLKKVIKLYEDDYKSDELDELEDELKDLEKELDELKSNKEYAYGRSGKVVWYGTKDAVEDSKG